MTTMTSQPKASTEGDKKGLIHSRSSKQSAMVVEEETLLDSHIWYWACREMGHGKKLCPNQKPSIDKGDARSRQAF